jgi:hypothetical protein
MLIAQTLENAGGSVSLLAVHLAVIHRIWSMISVYSASLRL